MQIIRDLDQLASIEDAFLSSYLHERFQDLCQGDIYDPEVCGYAVIAAIDTRAEAIEQVIGVSLLINPVTHLRWDDPGFVSVVEYAAHHPGWYELVIIPGDGDFGVMVFLPDSPEFDARLLALSANLAAQHQD